MASGTPKDVRPHAHSTMGTEDGTHGIFLLLSLGKLSPPFLPVPSTCVFQSKGVQERPATRPPGFILPSKLTRGVAVYRHLSECVSQVLYLCPMTGRYPTPLGSVQNSEESWECGRSHPQNNPGKKMSPLPPQKELSG